MLAFENLLPDTKSSTKRGYRFQPSTVESAAILTYQAKKERVQYAVEEFPCDFDGRAFRCVKADGESYDVLLADQEDDDICDCKGFVSVGHCKHLDCLRDLASEGQLPSPLCNADADVSVEECDDRYGDYAQTEEYPNETVSEFLVRAKAFTARLSTMAAELEAHIASAK